MGTFLKQMKFAALFALAASTNAIKLRASLKIKGWECPTQEQFNEVAGWVHNELTTGDKTITAAEAEAGFAAFAEKHSIDVTPAMKKEAEWLGTTLILTVTTNSMVLKS